MVLTLLSLLVAGSTEDLLARARAHEAAGETARAREALAEAVRRDPAWPMVRVELGRLLLLDGRAPREAFEHLDVARSLSPENPRAHYLFALAADEHGRRGEARRALEVALALRADFADAQVRLAGLLFAEGDFVGAARAYRVVAAATPAASGARLQLALALERSGGVREAEDELRSLMTLPPARVLAARRLAELLERQGRRADAEAVRAAAEPPRRQLRPLRPSSR